MTTNASLLIDGLMSEDKSFWVIALVPADRVQPLLRELEDVIGSHKKKNSPENFSLKSILDKYGAIVKDTDFGAPKAAQTLSAQYRFDAFQGKQSDNDEEYKKEVGLDHFSSPGM